MSLALIITLSGKIKVDWRWVWQIYFWICVFWYALFSCFSFTFWRVRSCCFNVWCFCTNRSWVQWLLTIFNIVLLKLKFAISHLYLKILFMVFFTIVSCFAHSISNPCNFSYSMTHCSPMGYIWRPSDSGIWAPHPGAFIHCVYGREPMIYKLWCHKIDGISESLSLNTWARMDGTIILTKNFP